ncbi:TPA: hypothetical protein ACSP74_004102 [Aeromonas veronii]
MKSVARYRSTLAQADILDSAVRLLGGDQFQQIQPIAAMVDRGTSQLDICPFAHGKRVVKKMPLKSANRACHPAVPEGAKNSIKSGWQAK